MSRWRSGSLKWGQKLVWGQKRLELGDGVEVNQGQTMKGHVHHSELAQIQWVSESRWRVFGRSRADLYFRKHPQGTRMESALEGQLSPGGVQGAKCS